MIKILVKAAILVCIILSIYFIVNPSACSNLINGRVVNSMDKQEPVFVPQDKDPHQELLTPAGDKPLRTDEETTSTATQDSTYAQPAQEESASQEAQPAAEEQPAQGDENAAASQEQQPAPAATQSYTQADIDYAIASRYVELENEYKNQKKDMKNAAKDISYIVMDDFELTPAEWETFLQRATADNLFEKVRQEQAAK